MSNPISGSKYIRFDFGTYITNNPSNTIKQLVEDVLLPQVQTVFPNAYYYSFPWGSGGTTKYAFISIPWSDGTIDDRLFIGIDKDETATIPTGYTILGLFYGVPNTTTVSSIVSNGNNYLRYCGTFRFVEFESGYGVGYNAYSQSAISCGALVCIGKNNTTNNDVNCLLNCNGNTNNVKFYVNDNGNIIDRSFCCQYPRNNTAGIGIVTGINSGDYHIENLYAYPWSYTSLKGVYDTDNSLLNNDLYENQMWYKNAFTINNQSFDAWILFSDGSSTGICRKHVEEV